MVICEFENGKRVPLRHITTGAIVVDAEGQVLLVKRADFLLEGGKWGVPGGYLDMDETVAEGITREILEETGYEITDLQLFKLITHPHRPNEDNRQNVEFLYLAKAGKQAGEPDNESSEVRWFGIQDIPWADIAFDHDEGLTSYMQHLETPLALPIVD